MNIQQARQKVLVKRIVGTAISASSVLSTAVSLLKMLYFRLDDGTQFGGMLAKPFKELVYWIYQNTYQSFGWFWEYSPTPNFKDLADYENGLFLTIYLLVFVGFAFIASANILAERLKRIRSKIEDQIIEESMRGQNTRTREQIERETDIPPSSIFSQFHQLYFAPIVVGVIAALLLKLLEL